MNKNNFKIRKIMFLLIISTIILTPILCGCSSSGNDGYVPIIAVDDNKSISFDGDNKITSSETGIDYVGSKDVGYVCLANTWREVRIPNIDQIPIAKEAEEYLAYEDPENKYLLILANYGEATGKQEELSAMIEKEPALGSTSIYYPSGSIEYLADTDYGYIKNNSIFKNSIPVGYEFYATVKRDDVEEVKYGLDDNNNIIRGTIFEYDGKRYGLMYMRYNQAWDIDLKSLCHYWIPQKATEQEIIDQIKNSPAMNKEDY